MNTSQPRYFCGVDGGGTGTRARLYRPSGEVLGEGRAGPSALGQGVAAAWTQIEMALAGALKDAQRHGHTEVPSTLTAAWRTQCALGLGLSGAENPGWRTAFFADAPTRPAFAHVELISDGQIGVLGVHGGRPGALLSVGTGCIGVAYQPDGHFVYVGGWGWQLGDEAGGAWLGRQAVQHAQRVMDEREPGGALAVAVRQHCGHNRLSLLDWCAQAGQTEFAALAPLVFLIEGQDPVAARLVLAAVTAMEEHILALDPAGTLPLVIAGSIGQRLQTRLSPSLRQRCVTPVGDACDGALYRLQQVFGPPSSLTVLTRACSPQHAHPSQPISSAVTS